MADKKPNILVIWGDDIGITNLSCYSDGLMGYRTPNIDRIAEGGDALHRLLRRAVLHRGPRRRSSPGRACFRTGLTKVGIPASPVGLQAEDPTIAELLKHARLRHRPVRQEPPRRPEQVPADRARLRRVLRQPLPPQRRRGAGDARLPAAKDFPKFRERFGPRGVLHCLGDRQGRPDRAAALGPGRQAEDRGHRPAHQEAHGDLRRRVRRRRQGLHQAPARGRQAVLLLGQHHAHAPRARTPSRRASGRPGAGSRPTTTR